MSDTLIACLEAGRTDRDTNAAIHMALGWRWNETALEWTHPAGGWSRRPPPDYLHSLDACRHATPRGWDLLDMGRRRHRNRLERSEPTSDGGGAVSDQTAKRLTERALSISRRHRACDGLTPPCKFDCLCRFEAADAEADRCMNLSDEEIRAEIRADGEDPDEVASRVRGVIRKAILRAGGGRG